MSRVESETRRRGERADRYRSSQIIPNPPAMKEADLFVTGTVRNHGMASYLLGNYKRWSSDTNISTGYTASLWFCSRTTLSSTISIKNSEGTGLFL